MDQLELAKNFLDNANNEEIEVFQSIINGLLRKQNKENGSYLGGILHARGDMIDDSTFEMSIPITKLIHNSLDMVHGGITFTLLDTAMGTLVTRILPTHLAVVTSEMKINYLQPGVGEQLICRASIIHQGTKIVVTEGKVYRDNGKMIAHATGSFFVIPRK